MFNTLRFHKHMLYNYNLFLDVAWRKCSGLSLTEIFIQIEIFKIKAKLKSLYLPSETGEKFNSSLFEKQNFIWYKTREEY